MTSRTNSGDKSMLPIGGMRSLKILRNGLVKMSSKGAMGLFGLNHESTACTIIATITMWKVVLMISTNASNISAIVTVLMSELKLFPCSLYIPANRIN
jgi:hypothetical protein